MAATSLHQAHPPHARQIALWLQQRHGVCVMSRQGRHMAVLAAARVTSHAPRRHQAHERGTVPEPGPARRPGYGPRHQAYELGKAPGPDPAHPRGYSLVDEYSMVCTSGFSTVSLLYYFRAAASLWSCRRRCWYGVRLCSCEARSRTEETATKPRP